MKKMTSRLAVLLLFAGCTVQQSMADQPTAETLPVSGLPPLVAPANPTEPAVRLSPPTTTTVPPTVPPTTLPAPTGLQGLPFAPSGLDECQEMNFYRIQWGLPERFGDGGRHQLWTKSDGLGWRESKCKNYVISSTGCCGGYWQIYISLFMKDHRMKPKLAACEVDSLGDVTGHEPYDKQRQACATAALYSVDPTAWRPM